MKYECGLCGGFSNDREGASGVEVEERVVKGFEGDGREAEEGL